MFAVPNRLGDDLRRHVRGWAACDDRLLRSLWLPPAPRRTHITRGVRRPRRSNDTSICPRAARLRCFRPPSHLPRWASRRGPSHVGDQSERPLYGLRSVGGAQIVQVSTRTLQGKLPLSSMRSSRRPRRRRVTPALLGLSRPRANSSGTYRNGRASQGDPMVIVPDRRVSNVADRRAIYRSGRRVGMHTTSYRRSQCGYLEDRISKNE